MNDEEGMSRERTLSTRDDERAVSTVVDVTLAILLVVVSLGLVVGVTDEPASSDVSMATETAETIGATTVTVSYSLESALDTANSELINDADAYDDATLTRNSHGTLAELLATAAVTNWSSSTIAQQSASDRNNSVLLPANAAFVEAIEETYMEDISPTNRDYEIYIRAVWRPFDASAVRGEAEIGTTPPEHARQNLAHLRIPSGIQSVQRETNESAVAAHEYDVVAEKLATAVIEERVPPAQSQRTLEGSGIAREVVILRYLQLAEFVPGIESHDPHVTDNLRREYVNTTAITESLIAGLQEIFESELENSFSNAHEAVAALRTEEVLIAITTWES